MILFRVSNFFCYSITLFGIERPHFRILSCYFLQPIPGGYRFPNTRGKPGCKLELDSSPFVGT